MGNESNFIPLFSLDDEERLRAEEIPEEIALLPLRNTLLFPGMVIPSAWAEPNPSSCRRTTPATISPSA